MIGTNIANLVQYFPLLCMVAVLGKKTHGFLVIGEKNWASGAGNGTTSVDVGAQPPSAASSWDATLQMAAALKEPLLLLYKKEAVSNRWTGLLEWTTGMDYWNGLWPFFFFFFFPRANYIHWGTCLALPLAHAGLACRVVLARAVPRDSTRRALDWNKTTPIFTVLFEWGHGLHS